MVMYGYLRTRTGSLHAYCDRFIAVAILHRVDSKVPECTAQLFGIPYTADPAFLLENEAASVHGNHFFNDDPRYVGKITFIQSQRNWLIRPNRSEERRVGK